jgi:hypothetical protein
MIGEKIKAKLNGLNGEIHDAEVANPADFNLGKPLKEDELMVFALTGVWLVKKKDCRRIK